MNHPKKILEPDQNARISRFFVNQTVKNWKLKGFSVTTQFCQKAGIVGICDALFVNQTVKMLEVVGSLV